MKTKYYFILLLLPIVFLTGCEDNSLSSGLYESQVSESQLITMAAQSNLIVRNTNGIIYITASDTANNIYCDIVKRVESLFSPNDAQSHLSQIVVSVEKNSDDINIQVDHPQENDRNYETALKIVLPDKFNYSLNLGNGEIAISATTRNLSANLGNGNIYADVTLIDTCNVSLLLGNGYIDLLIPETTNTKMTASIGNGNYSINGLNFQNLQMSNKQFSGVLGNGCGTTVLSIGNGNLDVSKK
jgi:hypothetical protein